jgi:hypothetical protein
MRVYMLYGITDLHMCMDKKQYVNKKLTCVMVKRSSSVIGSFFSEHHPKIKTSRFKMSE